jgi:hypothetical protein
VHILVAQRHSVWHARAATELKTARASKISQSYPLPPHHSSLSSGPPTHEQDDFRRRRIHAGSLLPAPQSSFSHLRSSAQASDDVGGGAPIPARSRRAGGRQPSGSCGGLLLAWGSLRLPDLQGGDGRRLLDPAARAGQGRPGGAAVERPAALAQRRAPACSPPVRPKVRDLISRLTIQILPNCTYLCLVLCLI